MNNGAQTMNLTPTLNYDTTKPGALSYDKTARSFYIEVSDIENLTASFWIYSVKTGVKKLFTYTKTVCDGEGDYLLWEYAGPSGFVLKVFND